MLWEYPDEQKDFLVSNYLVKHGALIGKLLTPNSTIYTFRRDNSKELVIAKCININQGTTKEVARQRIQRALYEINNSYMLMSYSPIQRFFDIEIILGVPFFLSRKRDATLFDLIHEGPLELGDMLVISCQIVNALCYCREKGIISHQDLKPENIFIDFPKNRFVDMENYPIKHLVYVADFELANAYQILGKKSGSRPYQPPEQHSKDIADFSKVDVFAIGVLMYEMSTGGIHPIGERTSDVWPSPLPLKGKKWEREDVWKKWAKTGEVNAKDLINVNKDLLLIINECLLSEFEKRINLHDLKEKLFKLLNQYSKSKHDTLCAIISMYDESKRINEEHGLPHYEILIRQLNEYYDFIN